jgi:hypothetical protein
MAGRFCDTKNSRIFGESFDWFVSFYVFLLAQFESKYFDINMLRRRGIDVWHWSHGIYSGWKQNEKEPQFGVAAASVEHRTTVGLFIKLHTGWGKRQTGSHWAQNQSVFLCRLIEIFRVVFLSPFTSKSLKSSENYIQSPPKVIDW